MARAERALARYAEPFQALYGTEWPERLLDLAWRRLIENSAHDSICGCSVDEVSTQVLVRCYEAEQIARGLAEDAAREAATEAPMGSVVAFNPSPTARWDNVGAQSRGSPPGGRTSRSSSRTGHGSPRRGSVVTSRCSTRSGCRARASPNGSAGDCTAESSSAGG